VTESSLLLFIHSLSTPLLDDFFVVSHALGQRLVFISLVLLCTAVHLVRGDRRSALSWLLTGLLTLGLLELLKQGVGRPRPRLWPWIVSQAGGSFPSGHAMASASLYTLLAADGARARPSRRLLLYAAAALASLWLGLGRLYLGLHWPTDVVAGWAIGAALGILAARWLTGSARKSGPEA
jgi:undecaprenyl-diphosphatase